MKTNEFKIHFIAKYNTGKSSRLIFEEAGLDDTRRTNSGRLRKRPLTDKEIIQNKNAEVEYLKAEIELLKKVRDRGNPRVDTINRKLNYIFQQ